MRKQERKNTKEQVRRKERVSRAGTTLAGDLMYLLLKILLIAAVMGMMFFFVFGTARCSDDSMSPAVKAGDLVIFYRLYKDYKAGDVVVLEQDGEKQIRRVAAVAGDTVDITEEGLVINGYLQQETGIYEETLAYTEGITFPLTVKTGEIFVLGDRRENAKDSRIYGCVEIQDTYGCAGIMIRRNSI
ncbi:Signal peptidase I S [uncultured Roseburia sp.]|uniref:Signal peptidase I n=1 Tax=Brotonthovivens ammoniilytica TaxID=2981725 RepID=A0ABT2THQ1_9FIRM|nr:signal peptidase I [Brotonthovivens ammoniilytica]MCU6761099.1 signal peptidase I [Brotonthovivens ammoniilytica]SCI18815.1 Signal peptidase I S [uncultured Roseburia sp.]